MQCSAPQHQWEPCPDPYFRRCAHCGAVCSDQSLDRNAQLEQIAKTRNLNTPCSHPDLNPWGKQAYQTCLRCCAPIWNPSIDKATYLRNLEARIMTPLQLHCLNATPSRKPRSWIKLALVYGLVCFISLGLAELILKLFHQ